MNEKVKTSIAITPKQCYQCANKKNNCSGKEPAHIKTKTRCRRTNACRK